MLLAMLERLQHGAVVKVLDDTRRE